MRSTTKIHRAGAAICALALMLALGHPAQAQLFDKVENTAGVDLLHNDGYKAGSDGTDDIMMNVGTGAAWFDMDNDGDLDLYVTQRRNAAGTLPNVLYENDGTGNFTEVAAARGAQDSGNHGCGVAAADYDNDGDKDLYLANCTEDVLLQNQFIETGTANFIDVTATAMGTSAFMPERGHSVAWGDYDGDGCLDFYVANHMPIDPDAAGSSQDYLYRNNCESATGGTTTFTDMSSLLAGDVDGDTYDDLEGFGFIGAFTDIDNDGDADIYLMNDCPFGLAQGFGRTEDNKLWRNDGGGVFTEISDTYGPLTTIGKDDFTGGGPKSDCQNAMGIAIGDPDRDGDFDYYYTNLEVDGAPSPGEQSATMIENDLGVGFNDVTAASGLFEAKVPPDSLIGRVTWGAVFIDYDLDMLQDLAVAAGAIFNEKNEPNMLYHNEGPGMVAPGAMFADGTTFTDVSSTSGIDDGELGGTKTIVMGDYDGDGDPDMYAVAFGETAHLYANNNSNGNNWLIVDVEGAGPAAGGSNKDGIGAKVHISTPDGVTQHYEVHSGTSLGGGDDVAAYFGMGTNGTADIEIEWPSGLVQTVAGVVANQRLNVVENVGTLTLTSPDGGELWQQGSVQNITWDSNLGGDVRLTLFKDGSLDRVIANRTENDGAFEWTVPSDTDGNTYKVSIRSFVDNTMRDESDNPFSILTGAPFLTVTSPNGGEVWTQGTTQAITWSSNVGGEVRIVLLKNGAFNMVISKRTDNDGALDWEVTATADASDYQVRIQSRTDPGLFDQSDGQFTIETAAAGSLAAKGASEGALTGQALAAAGAVPEQFSLQQNYPNPFNPETVISYGLAAETQVTLVVYDILGREVQRLVDGVQAAGAYRVRFSAGDLPSGLYIYTLKAGSFQSTQKMMLMR